MDRLKNLLSAAIILAGAIMLGAAVLLSGCGAFKEFASTPGAKDVALWVSWQGVTGLIDCILK